MDLEATLPTTAHGWFADLEQQAVNIEQWQKESLAARSQESDVMEGAQSIEESSDGGHESVERFEGDTVEDMGDGSDWVLPDLHHQDTDDDDHESAGDHASTQRKAWKPKYTEEHWDKQGHRGLLEAGDAEENYDTGESHNHGAQASSGAASKLQHTDNSYKDGGVNNLHHHENLGHVPYEQHPGRKLRDDGLRYRFKLVHGAEAMHSKRGSSGDL